MSGEMDSKKTMVGRFEACGYTDFREVWLEGLFVLFTAKIEVADGFLVIIERSSVKYIRGIIMHFFVEKSQLFVVWSSTSSSFSKYT